MVSTVIPSDYRWVALFSAWPFFVVASITAAIHTNRKWRKMATILGGAAFSGAILLGVFLSIEGISDAFELSPEQQRIIRERAIAPEGGPYVVDLISDDPCGKCDSFKRKIIETFEGLPGWAILPAAGFGTSYPPHGTQFLVHTTPEKDSAAASVMEKAFQAAGIPFNVRIVQPSPVIPGAFAIEVGPP
ncbi:MAG TPA: hypothetical protein VMF69_27920 [Gemmataceae bacterium]|nr:hypothetical protein [Gemmataceae bacterium]